MEKLFNTTSITAGILGGYLIKLLGGADTLLYCLLIAVIMDYTTGILKAIANKRLSSKVGFKGLTGKVMIFMIVACSVIISKLTEGIIPLRETTIMFFICNEIISLLENAAEFVNIPPKLREILLQLRQKGEDNNENK